MKERFVVGLTEELLLKASNVSVSMHLTPLTNSQQTVKEPAQVSDNSSLFACVWEQRFLSPRHFGAPRA